MASTDEKPIVKRAQAMISRVQSFKPVRVLQQYGRRRGSLLANGLSYQSIFATFAALWVSFSVAGFVLRSNDTLLDALVRQISLAIPGLLDTGDGNGAIEVSTLLSSATLSWTGAIALVGLLLTAVGWLAAARAAVRTLFGLDPSETNFLLLKLKDLGLALAFGVAVLVSSTLAVFSTQALGSVLRLFDIRRDSEIGSFFVQALVVGITFALDTVVLAALYRVLANIEIPIRRLLPGALIGAALLGVLKTLGSALLGGASNNPLLASFAVIIGLLIWFNLVCQVILIAASWIAVDLSDHGILLVPDVDPAVDPDGNADETDDTTQPNLLERIGRAIRRRRDR